MIMPTKVDYALREWPRAVRVEQKQLGSTNASVYDAETGAQLDRVFSIQLDLSRRTSVVRVTMSKYVPDKPALLANPTDIHYMDEVVVETRAYFVETVELATLVVK